MKPARIGPWLAAAVAAVAASPGLFFPFLSDDWRQIQAIVSTLPAQTPFGDFRPLFMASLWLDYRLFGLSPALFHLTNLLLLSAAAGLVVLVVRRLTGDSLLAALTGLLFAVHPYHVENAAWVAARADPLFTIFFLLALLAYDRWWKGLDSQKGSSAATSRFSLRRVPWLSLLFLEVSLLSKEAALVFPIVVVLLSYTEGTPGVRPGSAPRPVRKQAWLHGVLPLFLLVLVHFLVLRTWVLGGTGRTLISGPFTGWIKRAAGYTTGILLPADLEILSHQPSLWASMALVLLLMLGTLAWHYGGLPSLAFTTGLVFFVVLLPSLVGFQERYTLLPTAVGSLFLISLLCRGGKIAALVAVLLVGAWLLALTQNWGRWQETATASETLVQDLVEASRRPGVEELTVANMPFQVQGGSVAGDFQAALALLGERAVLVRTGLYVAYPDATSDALDGPPEQSLTVSPDAAEVRLQVTPAPFSRIVGPFPSPGESTFTWHSTQVEFTGENEALIRLERDAADRHAAYAWVDGRLKFLF